MAEGWARALRRFTAIAAMTVVAASQAIAPDPAQAGTRFVYVPIIIYTPYQPPPPYRSPPGAYLEVAVTDDPPTRMAGEVHPNEVLAVHKLQVRDAIVLQQRVDAGGREMPAGTVLSLVLISGAQGPSSVWCDLRSAGDARGATTYECLAANNALQIYGGLQVKTDDDMLGVDGGGQPTRLRPIAPSATARKARPDERPAGQIGYAWCGGDPAGPPRFEVAVSLAGGRWRTSSRHQCALGGWSDASDRSVVALDHLRLRLGAGGDAQTLAFTADGRAQAGPMAKLVPGGPIRSESEAISELAGMGGADQAIVYDPQSGKVASGSVFDGDVLFSVRARLGVTGVLAGDILPGARTAGGPPATPLLAAGQPVFGWRSQLEWQGEVIWCAPQKGESGSWYKSVCLSNDGQGVYAIDALPAFMPADAHPQLRGRAYVSPPQVKLSPQDFPSLAIDYVLTRWRDNLVEVTLWVDWGDGKVPVRQVPVQMQGGVASVVTPGGTLRLSKQGDWVDVRFEPAPPPAPPVIAAPSSTPEPGAIGSAPLTAITDPILAKPSLRP